MTVSDKVDGRQLNDNWMGTKSIFSNGSAHVLPFYTKTISIGQNLSRDIYIFRTVSKAFGKMKTNKHGG